MGIRIYDRLERPRSPFGVKWSENGKRRFKFFGVKKDRDEFMSGLQKVADRQGRAILELSAADAVIMAECIRRAGSATAVLRAVDRFADAARAIKEPLADAMQEYQDELLNAGRNDDYRRHVKKVLERFPAVGMASEVSGEVARKWAAGLSGFAPVTLRGQIKTMLAFWNWLVLRGYASENVFRQVPAPAVVESEPGFLTVDEAAALFGAAVKDYPDAVAYFALGAFAGLRSTAITRLSGKDHVRFEQRGILITGQNAKNSRRQFVDGHEPNLWAWLEWAREHAPAGLDLEARLWERRREQVAKVAGVVMPHNALRHSFCTYHCAFHGDAGRTATLLTHRGNVSILYQHYKGNATRADAERYFSIRP